MSLATSYSCRAWHWFRQQSPETRFQPLPISLSAAFEAKGSRISWVFHLVLSLQGLAKGLDQQNPSLPGCSRGLHRARLRCAFELASELEDQQLKALDASGRHAECHRRALFAEEGKQLNS